MLETQGQACRQVRGREGNRRLADRWTALTEGPPVVPAGEDSDAGEPAATGEIPEKPHITASVIPQAVQGSAREPRASEHQQPTPAEDAGPVQAGGRLGKGQLRALVLAHLQAHPHEETSPTAVAKALGRSAGAVGNALDKLAADGTITQTRVAPRRYCMKPCQADRRGG